MPRHGKGFDRPLLSLTESPLTSIGTTWHTSPSYEHLSSHFSAPAFESVLDALLENPNLNSTHVFRADIVSDSSGRLKTNREKELACCINQLDVSGTSQRVQTGEINDEARHPISVREYKPSRTVLRNFVPRNPKRDKSLLQTCHVYAREGGAKAGDGDELRHQARCGTHCSLQPTMEDEPSAHVPQTLVVYQPHSDPQTGGGMPWYHPPLKYLAFLYSCKSPSDAGEATTMRGSLSIHFQLFPESCSDDVVPSITNRTHRTLLSLLSTFVRMIRSTILGTHHIDEPIADRSSGGPRSIKDNIVPEHLVQNTYSRLKSLYASDLIERWVEKTDPLKHVFEDLLIASFLIELWRKMLSGNLSAFTGFVDIACGNGVLVYILIKEGFRGWGFDARVRRGWSTFPDSVASHLHEKVCIPQPFLERLRSEKYPLPAEVSIMDGIFEEDTFIISNHADELTAWTPLLAALSCPEMPLPWLSIPCCSHALSGAPHRYPQTDRGSRRANQVARRLDDSTVGSTVETESTEIGSEPKLPTKTDSTYASLVSQVVSLAKRVDPRQDVQQTLMRIPSTRNSGIIGGQQRMLRSSDWRSDMSRSKPEETSEDRLAQIIEIVDEECKKSKGVSAAATTWMEAVKKARGSTRHVVKST